MSPVEVGAPKWWLRVRELFAILLFVSLVSGCGSWVFPGKKLQVNPDVIRDIRDAGKVVSEADMEIPWDGSSTVIKILIIDTESPSVKEAINRSSNFLHSLEWKAIDQEDPLRMKSQKWKNVSLSMEPIDSYQFLELDSPQVTKAIEMARRQTMPEALMVLELYPTG
ncbi:hypothetical protein ACFY3V_14295 [Streptosporangium sp. NPDC000095]|uniref:hypothetical protein n=1 Tax=Streptosporangium sp. NPDC000095 TaxID=3366184 RepID=UPI0036BAFBF6